MVEYERSGTERAGVQLADDQKSSALRYFTIALFRNCLLVGSQPPAACRGPFSYSMTMLRCTKTFLLAVFGDPS